MLLPCPLGFRETPVTAIRRLARNCAAASLVLVMSDPSALPWARQGAGPHVPHRLRFRGRRRQGPKVTPHGSTARSLGPPPRIASRSETPRAQSHEHEPWPGSCLNHARPAACEEVVNQGSSSAIGGFFRDGGTAALVDNFLTCRRSGVVQIRQLPGQGSCSCDWARGVSDRLAIRGGGPQLRAVDP